MEKFIFNDHNVCLNPDILFQVGDYKEGEITIKLAYHLPSEKWCAASDWQTSTEGSGSGCSVCCGNVSKEDAIQKEIDRIERQIHKFPVHIQKAFKKFRVSAGAVKKGDQLILF